MQIPVRPITIEERFIRPSTQTGLRAPIIFELGETSKLLIAVAACIIGAVIIYELATQYHSMQQINKEQKTIERCKPSK